MRNWLKEFAGNKPRKVSRPLALTNRTVLRLEQLEGRDVPSATAFDVAPPSTQAMVFTSTPAAQGTGTYSSQNEAYVGALYNDVLDRDPDSTGLAGWTNLLNNGSLTRQQVAFNFLTSNENQINTVNSLYQEILGRPADQSGLDWWVKGLQNGMSYNEVRAAIFASDEFFVKSGGTNNGFLSALYLTQFGRPIDPSGQAWWSNAFANGATRFDVAFQVVQSPESNGNLVASFYSSYLGRTPDQGGYDYWTQQLAKGRSPQYVASQILGSPEFFNNVASQVV